MSLDNQVENIVNENPGLFRRVGGFLRDKALPIVLTGSIFVTGTLGYFGCGGSKKNPIYPTGPATEFVEPDQSKIVQDPDNGLYLIEDQLMVGFNNGVSDAEKEDIVKSVNGKIVAINENLGIFQVNVPIISLNDLYTKADLLENDVRVEFASPNYGLEPTLAPNDPEAAFPDAAGTWDETTPWGNNWAWEYIKAPSAWTYTTGNPNVKIGIIDTGFDVDHEDLVDNITSTYPSPLFIPDDPHGSKVAGIIGAKGDNGIGIAGMNWNANLNLYTTHKNNILRLIFDSSMLSNMERCIEDGVKVINLSLGHDWEGHIPSDANPKDLEVLDDKTDEYRKVFTQLKNNGVLLIKSAGNLGIDAKWNGIITPTLAAEFPDNFILVAANNWDGERSTAGTWSSNYGSLVTVSAPGSCGGDNLIQTCTENNGYDFDWGTSMAAPFVTGLASLLLSINPSLTPAQIKQAIVNGAQTGEKFFTDPATNDIYIINCLESILQISEGWQIETVETHYDLAWPSSVVWNSITLDTNNRPHISFYHGDDGTLRYAFNDGIAWQKEIVDDDTGFAGAVGLWNSIILDTNNNPHISHYIDRTSDLRYAHHDGTNWVKETIDGIGVEVGEYSSISSDNLNRIHISYYAYKDSSTNNDLKYALYDGSSWQIETVDATGGRGDYSSIATDSNNRPHISYYNDTNRNLMYAYHDGITWNIETVDSFDVVGISTSMVIDSNNKPHISYYDFTNKDVKYAHHDGVGWNIERIDDAEDVNFTYPVTSIDVDSNNKPHISYSNWYPNYDLKYAHHDGITWNIETVDTGLYNSIAVDSNNKPHISYQSLEGGDSTLKYGWKIK